MDAPRLRIAPSPTGYFHVGTARTALYNWLVARQTGGTFLLRIEDTDTARNLDDAVLGIQRALTWLGLDWDGEPSFQSTRRDAQRAAALRLVDEGHAYWSDPMPLDDKGQGIAYDGRHRDLGLAAADGRALRFRTPTEGSTTVPDIVRGNPVFEHTTIEDFALLRGNGDPLWILANVVDDIDDRITHVVRGEDHLTNTPKYILLWQALGGPALPVFAHLPLLVNEKRQKLSKRRDKVALEDFRDEGYLPEVMANYLALLGWGSGERERFSLTELIGEFRLEDVVGSPAFFDLKKLDAFNADAIRELSTAELVERARPWLEGPGAPWPKERYDPAVVEAMAPHVQTRIVRLAEFPGMIDFLLLDEPDIKAPAWEKDVVKQPAAAALLDAVIAGYADPSLEWRGSDEGDELAPLKSVAFDAGDALGLNRKKAQAPVRVAITGRSIGPPLFESIQVLGREETVRRLAAARTRLG